MKILIFFSILLNCILVNGQKIDSLQLYYNSNSENILDEINDVNKRNLVEMLIPIYLPDTLMFSSLERIINIQKGCSNTQNNENKFYLIINKESAYYRLLFISITKVDIDYRNCFGLFNYHGVNFICKGESIKELLQKSNQQPINIKYSTNEKIIFGIDDSFSEWVYLYNGKTITLVKERLCEGYKK